MVKKLPKIKRAARTYETLELPSEKKHIETDISLYTFLLYGREKIGKTITFSKCPEAIFFTTEPGTKGLEIFEFNYKNGGIKDWNIFRRGVDVLLASDRFKTVVIDTVDKAYDMCLDYICNEWGIDYPGFTPIGKNDYGKSWKAIRKEFVYQIDRIIQSGRGVCFTSHATEEEFESISGAKFHRIGPSMSNQAKKVVTALVDMFFYAEYVKDVRGKSLRILICEGDEMIFAGARPGAIKCFPKYLPMDAENGWKIIEDAFYGRNLGLDPAEISATNLTTETGKEFLERRKLERIRGKRLQGITVPKKLTRN
ncbi:MAG: ATP-binding protein [Planctomycetes bacterium]|nr:ATP-binding protein [Planctomycetota bacterium]